MRPPAIYRLYHGELLSLRAIAALTGFPRDTVERAAKQSHDVTERLALLRQRADIRLCAASLGLAMGTVRTRRWRGASVAEALRSEG